ncbi:MAG: helix-turn-helix domain-containing protein [Chitinophagaceae bacterium]|nr:helix-turn-helix domain-containing protein [Chitinophagaceae bacterium]
MGKEAKIEKYVINKVKQRRTDLGISQAELAHLLDVSEGFIGNIENPNYPEKYNLRHLNDLAKILKCSPKDFLPDKPL